MLQVDGGGAISRCIPRESTYIDNNIMGNYSTIYAIPNYIDVKYIGHATVPLIFNGIKFTTSTFGIPYTAEDILTNYLESTNTELRNKFEEIDNDTFYYVKIYFDRPDEIVDKIDNDLVKAIPSALTELYNKCMAQVTLRQELEWEAHDRVLVSKAKHIVVIISNFNDSAQASDFFLTLGLTPLLFKDFGEKFSKEELDYFKGLVNRSQVKRISNIQIVELFNKMIIINKYKTLIKERMLDATLTNLTNRRVEYLKGSLDSYEREAQNYLQRYESSKRGFYEMSKLYEAYMNDKDGTINEFKTALNSPHVVEVIDYNDELRLHIKAPVEFYDTDEVECSIKHMRNAKIKQFIQDVFLDHKYKLYLLGTYHFKLNGEANINTSNNYNTNTLVDNNSLFNPHLHFYNCLGDYKSQLIDAQHKQDLLIFINLAVASIKSINFSDSVVVNHWYDWLESLFNNDTYEQNLLFSKCLEDKDGNLHSLDELYNEHEVTEISVQDASWTEDEEDTPDVDI